MNTKKRIRAILAFAIAAVCMAGLLAAPASAETLFSDDFENPVVEGYAQGTTPSGWVRATQGYGGGRHGLNNLGDNQVYSFRYTNSGITSAEGVIGALEAGVTYIVSFDVSTDQDLTRDSYNAALMVFDAEVARNDVRTTPSGATLIASVSGNAPDDGSWATVSFEFTADAIDNAAILGKDMAVRFKGATSSANIDNVTVATAAPPAEAPSVDVGPDMISWSGEGVQMSPLVINNDPNDPQTPLTYTWSAVPTAHALVEFSPGAYVEDPIITITKVSEIAGANAQNGGFEEPALADGASVNTGSVPGWITQWSAEGSGVWATDNSPNGGARDLIAGDDYDGVAPEGENIGYVNVDAGYSHALYQDTSVALESGKTYELSAKIGNPYVINGGYGPDYRLELLVNGEIIASKSGMSPADANSWASDSVFYVTSASDPNEGNPLSIRLVAEAGDVAQTLYFDDVKLLIDGQSGTEVAAPELVSVYITLAANNEGSTIEDGTDTLIIDVYDDACAAAKALGATVTVTDFDNDCDTDFDDLYVIIDAWMTDYSLKAPETKY